MYKTFAVTVNETGTPSRKAALSKVYCSGTHRAVEPRETLDRLGRFYGAFGITRVADITGLDSIGIPVAVATRPGSRSNITFQGKGLDRTAAKVSAVMEAVETCCAERISGPLVWASPSEMRQAGRHIVDFSHLSFRLGARFSAETRILWFEGQHLIGGGTCWLPFESVHTNFTLPAPAGSGYFVASTNGLASGNDRREALVHGLCELIERDAQVLFSLASEGIDSRRLDLTSVDDPDAAAVLSQISGRGFVVAVWDLTSDIGLAAFKCHIMERHGGPGLMPLPAEGHGCHPDKRVALMRAVLEAVQSRATIIAGSRDDVGPALYARFDDMADLARWRERLGSDASACSFGNVPHAYHATVDEDIDHIVERLRRAGLNDVIVSDLQPDESIPASVVRVVAPGLEGPLDPGVALGHRARAQMERIS
ncbi:YcaO-like family protein [Microvirga sp. KLBC 81]|uniref:YcaO-like family protein n=1 Tax=Microvirga sp. KLBC 81 TaxID=1862707 RepID=UPI000E3047A8|nr:YcaO-like family protein [Microvirga sp. KLBC 81]